MKRTIQGFLMITVMVLALLSGNVSVADRPDWQTFYQYFIQSGEYSKVLSTPVSEYRGMLMERDQQWDCFAVHDMNGDGIPELIAAACVVIVQVRKRSSLISILTGTAVYMLLLQLVF